MVREKFTALRLTTEEHAALAKAAKREDRPVSYIIRRAITRELERLEAEGRKGRGKRGGP